MAEAERDTEVKSKKSRSPAYPSDGLETCLKWAKKIYDAEKKSTTSSEIAARHMGYSSLSGASRVALSAMKKFGLLVEEGAERVRVSDDAIRYFLQPDESEQLKLLRSLAVRPQIIKDVLTEYKYELPSDSTLKYKLVTDGGFGEDGASTFIKALRETVTFAKLGPDQYGSTPMDDAKPVEQQDDKGSSGSFPLDLIFGRAARGTPPPPVERREQQVPQPIAGASFRLELSDGASVVIQSTHRLTADAVEEVREHLELYEKRLRRRAQLPPPDEA